MGTIGSITAEIAHNGFGMDIIYSGRSRKGDLEKTLQAQFLPLSEVLARADVLSLHAAVTEQTTGMIGDKELHSMKPSAVLINTSRAELVNAKALKKALEERTISCAAFDGYYQEPVPKPEDDRWGLLGLSAEIFLVTPHTAYFTEDATRAMAKISTTSILQMLDGHPPQNLVNPEYCKAQG
jgi:gluconate 2-dehydrogenase